MQGAFGQDAVTAAENWSKAVQIAVQVPAARFILPRYSDQRLWWPSWDSDCSLPHVASAPLLESITALDVLANHVYNHSITQFCQKCNGQREKNPKPVKIVEKVIMQTETLAAVRGTQLLELKGSWLLLWLHHCWTVRVKWQAFLQLEVTLL